MTTATEARYIEARRRFHDLRLRPTVASVALVVGCYLGGTVAGAVIQTLHHLRITRKDHRHA